MSGGLTLNSFEVDLSKSELTLHRTMYSKESFDRYKNDSDSYFFYRYSTDERDWIYAWKRKQTNDELPEDFQTAQVKLEEHAPIFTKIVEEATVQLFKQRSYDTFKVPYSSM